jgi:Flp pilus assembly pilin Flp
MSKALIKRLASEEEAGTAVEYGLITAVIAVGLIVALVAFRNKLIGWFNTIGDNITGT